MRPARQALASEECAVSTSAVPLSNVDKIKILDEKIFLDDGISAAKVLSARPDKAIEICISSSMLIFSLYLSWQPPVD